MLWAVIQHSRIYVTYLLRFQVESMMYPKIFRAAVMMALQKLNPNPSLHLHLHLESPALSQCKGLVVVVVVVVVART